MHIKTILMRISKFFDIFQIAYGNTLECGGDFRRRFLARLVLARKRRF